jgi:hypothetical protein
MKPSRAALCLSITAGCSVMAGAQSQSPSGQPLPAFQWRVGGALYAGAGQVGPALSVGLDQALGDSIFRNHLTLDLGLVPGYGAAFGLDEQVTGNLVTGNLVSGDFGSVYAGLGVGLASTSDLIRDYGSQTFIGGFNVSAVLGYQGALGERPAQPQLSWYVEGGARYFPVSLVFGANGSALSLRAGLTLH